MHSYLATPSYRTPYFLYPIKVQLMKTIIVEDNLSFAIELEMLVKKIGHEVLSVVDNSGDALVDILSKKPDMIFMDIDIKGKLSGLQIAEKIKHLHIPVIFVTSHADEEHFVKANDIPNSTFITKPVAEYTLKSAINLLMKISHSIITTSSSPEFRVENGNIYLKKKEDFIKIESKEIQYVESNDVYCKTVTVDDTEFLNRISLTEYIDLLGDDKFVRPHRSFLVNSANITKVNLNDNAIIMGKHIIPISRNAKKEIKNYLTLIT